MVNGDAPIVAKGALAVKAAAKKPAHKKVAVKPKPDVIEISPGTEEQVKENKQKKKAGDDSSLKKATLTSTLTARSKVGIFCLILEQLYSVIFLYFVV